MPVGMRRYPVQSGRRCVNVNAGHWQQWPAWSPLHQGVAGCGPAGPGTARLVRAGQGSARQGRWRTSLKTAQRQAHSLSVFGAVAGRGAAWHGEAWRGKVWRGMAREVAVLVKNRPAPSAFPECVWPCGLAWLGLARLGMARPGRARARKGTSTRTTQWQH